MYQHTMSISALKVGASNLLRVFFLLKYTFGSSFSHDLQLIKLS